MTIFHTTEAQRAQSDTELLDLGFGMSNLEIRSIHFFKNTEYPDLLFPNVLKKISLFPLELNFLYMIYLEGTKKITKNNIY